MPIFDQFETEPYATYSGSYTDRYYYGSIFNDNYSTTRSTIAVKTTGLISSSFYQKDMSRSDQLGYVSGEYISSKTQNGNTKLFSINELIYNSLTPSPIGIAKTNNQLLPYLATTSSWKQIFSASLDAAPKLNRPNLTEDSANIFLTAQATNIPAPSPSNNLTVPINSFSDVKWLYEYPFQGKYKNLQLYLGTALDNVDIEVDLYSGSFLSPPVTTNELGSLFYTYGDGTYKNYSQYSQIWLGVGAKNDIEHVHIPIKMFNNLQKICYSNYSGSQSSAYVGFGECGTIITSSIGWPYYWEPICFERNDVATTIPNEAYINSIQVDSWTASTTGSIRNAIAVPWENGKHHQWLLVLEDTRNSPLLLTSPKGKLVRTKLVLQKNSDYKIPTKDQWEYLDLDTKFGNKVDIHGLFYTNPAGDVVSSEFVPGIVAVGRIFDVGLGGWSSFIATATNINDPTGDTGDWFRYTGGSGFANKTDCIYYSVTGDKHDDLIGGTTHLWVCGYDASINAGLIGRNSTPGSAIAFTDITPAGIFGGAANVPILRSIDYHIVSGSTTSWSNLICVGDNGTILRSVNGGVTWTKPSPANSYTGNFVEVKKVYNLNSNHTYPQKNIEWIIIGDDGEIQCSEDGITWKSLRTGFVGLQASINYPNRLYASSSLSSSINGSVDWKNHIYQKQNNSFRSYYAGSLERTLITSTANILKPAYPVAVGGVSIHDFNKFENGKTVMNTNTVLICRLGDASGSWRQDLNAGHTYDHLPQVDLKSVFSAKRPVTTWIKPTNYDYNKAFFGYGDGFNLDLREWEYGSVIEVGKKGKTPNFLDWSPYDLYGHIDIPQFNLYNPQIRGWKYGLYSGINTPSSAVWRRGKYGQFRDMLEQRIYTKNIQLQQQNPYNFPANAIKRTVDSPISVEFVTGSAIFADTVDYVTATNPSYNPYDSGIYDREYRSGQPFFDRGNED